MEYTFGQIIDKLQPGQMAVSDDGRRIACVSNGDILIENGNYLRTASYNRNRKWKIEPQEITAIEAMQRIIDRKMVKHVSDSDISALYNATDMLFLGYLTSGKWYAID